MSRSKRCAAGFLFLLLVLLLGIARSKAEQLPIRTYTTADGLARDRVYKIVSDPRGFLWFCTYDGLSRFDGYEFVNYTVDDGLPHHLIFDLLITRNGEYWVATSNGVARFNPNATRPNPKFKAYVPNQRPKSESISALYEDESGTIWAGTGNGLFRLRETASEVQFEYTNLGEKTEEQLIISTIVEDQAGVLWVGTESGLYRHYSDGRAERFTTKNGLPHDDIRDILRDKDGTVWIATGLGLCRLKPDIHAGDQIVSRLYTKKDGMLSENINALFRNSTGSLWIATTAGLSEFSPEPLPDGGYFINYTREHGLSDVGLRAITEDNYGNLWLGTESGGAMKVIRRGFTSYSEADGLELARIAAIGEDHNGELFVITNSLAVPSFHIHRFDGRRFKNIKVNLPAGVVPSWGWNQLFVEDRAQQWWVPTTTALFRFPALQTLDDFSRVSPVKAYTSRDGMSGNEAFRLFEDSRGDVWLSIISTLSNSYLNRWERATDKFYSYPQSIALRPDSAPTAFQQDRAGNLWIGFYWGSLARMSNGKFDSFTKADGVPGGMIRALHLDQKGRMWIAGAEGGLGRIDDPSLDHPKIVLYTTKEGLSSDQVSCITEDSWGRIYVGTGLGVDRLDPETGRVKRYTIADGLPNGFVNIAYKDRNNALWFGTLQGLSKLIPSADGPPLPPPILIQHVRVAGNDLPISELGERDVPNEEFAADKNQLEIKFVSLGFRAGDVLRYQFKLEGADADWSAPTNQRSVNYANLKPGSYRFRVRALNADDMFSTEPASFSFTIVPPLWQRWWFIMLAVVALAGVTHLIYRYHTRRLIELERVRTRIATDLHDDIGSNLSKIAILSEVASQQLSSSSVSPATTPLGQIAETSRDCVDAMSDIVWAINPQRDHLSDLTHRMRRFAEDLLDAKDIDLTVHSALEETDVRLGAELRREVYLIFKECVTNLVKHSKCSKAELVFRVDGPYLTISVRDNGKGFKPAKPGENGTPAGMGGHGLVSMERRAQRIGGRLQIDSEVGRDTVVTLTVPIMQRSRWLRWPFNYPNGR
ncbi:MAG TPA: two-component regulator propeller domain-containing protein [Pyrinomonadaceae bacterium]|nr:two-component regulator propeller domain-containing protein [Pyrinomonadaceae bacterium]